MGLPTNTLEILSRSSLDYPVCKGVWWAYNADALRAWPLNKLKTTNYIPFLKSRALNLETLPPIHAMHNLSLFVLNKCMHSPLTSYDFLGNMLSFHASP